MPGKRLIAPGKQRVKHWNLYRDGITQGFLEKLLSCPRKAELAYEERLSAVRFKGALKFGDVVHQTLDGIYSTFRDTGDAGKARMFGNAFLAADETLTLRQLQDIPQPDINVENEIAEIYAVAGVLLDAYFDRWKEDLTTRKWLALEKTFRVPYKPASFKRAIPIRGKLDGTFMHGKGRQKKWMLETKTKSQINEEALQETLGYDLQCMLYLWAEWELTGVLPTGVLYNVMRRPALKRKVNEGIKDFAERVRDDIAKRRDFYFVRFEVALVPADVEKWLVEFNEMLEYAIMFAAGHYRFKVSSQCNNKYGMCEFLQICSRGDSRWVQRRAEIYPELVQIEKG